MSHDKLPSSGSLPADSVTQPCIPVLYNRRRQISYCTFVEGQVHAKKVAFCGGGSDQRLLSNPSARGTAQSRQGSVCDGAWQMFGRWVLPAEIQLGPRTMHEYHAACSAHDWHKLITFEWSGMRTMGVYHGRPTDADDDDDTFRFVSRCIAGNWWILPTPYHSSKFVSMPEKYNDARSGMLFSRRVASVRQGYLPFLFLITRNLGWYNPLLKIV